MIILSATNQSLEMVTSVASSIDYTSSYADITTTTFAPDGGQGNVVTAATTTIVAAPAASTQRQVKLLTICNRGVSQTVYLQKNVGGTLIRMTPDLVIATGEVLQYLDGQGFSVLDPFARSKLVSSTTLVNAPTANSQWSVMDADGTFTMNKLLAEHTITNIIMNSAFNLNFDLETLRGDILRAII
jgi:hypothetical protein